jgi:hypothetical protein
VGVCLHDLELRGAQYGRPAHSGSSPALYVTLYPDKSTPLVPAASHIKPIHILEHVSLTSLDGASGLCNIHLYVSFQYTYIFFSENNLSLKLYDENSLGIYCASYKH